MNYVIDNFTFRNLLFVSGLLSLHACGDPVDVRPYSARAAIEESIIVWTGREPIPLIDALLNVRMGRFQRYYDSIEILEYHAYFLQGNDAVTVGSVQADTITLERINWINASPRYSISNIYQKPAPTTVVWQVANFSGDTFSVQHSLCSQLTIDTTDLRFPAIGEEIRFHFGGQPEKPLIIDVFVGGSSATNERFMHRLLLFDSAMVVIPSEVVNKCLDVNPAYIRVAIVHARIEMFTTAKGQLVAVQSTASDNVKIVK